MPKIIVLYGGEAYERIGRLLCSMMNADIDHAHFGRVMVDMMTLPDPITQDDVVRLLSHYMRRFELIGTDDVGFDQRIVYEALSYGAYAFRKAWSTQVPPEICLQDYSFKQWMGSDLMLERR